jgi:hypothetical protein
MTGGERAAWCAWSDQGTGISPPPGGLVCAGMIGVAGSLQSTVDSSQLRDGRENRGKRFNAEAAEGTDFAEPEPECGWGRGMCDQ